MDVMLPHIRTLLHLGLWREPNERRLVKYIWRPFVICIIFLSTAWLLTATRTSRGEVQELTERTFVSLTYVSLCLKLLDFMRRRDEMSRLLSEFRAEICRPRNSEELRITSEYEKTIRLIFHWYMGVAQLTGLAFLSLPLISVLGGDDDHRVDFPSDIHRICRRESRGLCFSLVYALQALGVVIGILANVALDTMPPCFALLTCGQIDLCCRRFVSSGIREIRRCVRHQIFIWEIVRKLELFFMRVAVPIVLIALIMLCTSVYNLSKAQIGDPESLTFFMFIWTMLLQILCCCWFGNELKLKSTALRETVYSSDWTKLKPSDRKSLWFIMLSCQRERGMSLQGFCTISLEMFVWVLKTSYAAYNLL